MNNHAKILSTYFFYREIEMDDINTAPGAARRCAWLTINEHCDHNNDYSGYAGYASGKYEIRWTGVDENGHYGTFTRIVHSVAELNSVLQPILKANERKAKAFIRSREEERKAEARAVNNSLLARVGHLRKEADELEKKARG